MNLTKTLRSLLNRLSLDVKRHPTIDLRRRKKLLKTHNISKILDVGANSGQYALEMFSLGFNGEIVSFEPVKSTFNSLNKKVKNTKNWTAFNYGLGNKNQEMSINVSKNSYSSSLLEITPNHLESASESIVVHKETVIIKKLDSVFKDIASYGNAVLLKIDVQGFEPNVLEGAKESLKFIKGIQLEMSIEEMYKGELLIVDMINLLNSYGYILSSLENGFYNSQTGKLLQVDGIFFRE